MSPWSYSLQPYQFSLKPLTTSMNQKPERLQFIMAIYEQHVIGNPD